MEIKKETSPKKAVNNPNYIAIIVAIIAAIASILAAIIGTNNATNVKVEIANESQIYQEQISDLQNKYLSALQEIKNLEMSLESIKTNYKTLDHQYGNMINKYSVLSTRLSEFESNVKINDFSSPTSDIEITPTPDVEITPTPKINSPIPTSINGFTPNSLFLNKDAVWIQDLEVVDGKLYDKGATNQDNWGNIYEMSYSYYSLHFTVFLNRKYTKLEIVTAPTTSIMRNNGSNRLSIANVDKNESLVYRTININSNPYVEVLDVTGINQLEIGIGNSTYNNFIIFAGRLI